MEPAERCDDSIRELKEILSSIGLHAGAVVLTKNKKSNPTQDNPNKICMGGSKARHFLANHSHSNSRTEFEIWKKVCDVYRGIDYRIGIKQARVWETCDQMVERPHLSENDIKSLKHTISKFTGEMVEAWGEMHITHYMVRRQATLF